MRGALAAALLLAGACGGSSREPDRAAQARERMVAQIEAYRDGYAVTDRRVLDALRRVPRHRFVPPGVAAFAYTDRPLPIGEGQTISQPYIVAAMTQALDVKAGERVLEVGTGSGYQAAVLAELGAEVYTIEILEGLGRRAEATLKALGYGAVRVRVGDGYKGWPEAAPFDAVIVTCAPERVPPALVAQLREGGRLVIPVGPDLDKEPGGEQVLYLMRKKGAGLERQALLPVRFVPMMGAER